MADYDANLPGTQSLTDWRQHERISRNYVDMRTLGAEGLRQFGGHINEATLRDLEGKRAVEIYKDMADNDSTCGVILYAMMHMLKQVSWSVPPVSTAEFDIKAADFVESCMHDMDGQTWSDFVSESFMGMLRFGFSYHEQCFKRRAGDADEPTLRSHYADGRIGWRCIPGRSQDSITRWLFDDAGNLLGAEQQAPPQYRLTELPLSKCVLFRTTIEKGSPEGRSIFRSAYRSWVIKRGLENIEAVGVEKDITGLPIVWVPRELLALSQEPAFFDDGTPNTQVQQARRIVEVYKTMATEVRRDAKEGLVLPLEYDESGNKKFDISLLQTSGPRAYDVDKIISRYDARIAMSTMSDFLLLGQGATAQGSWAMHSDKTKLWLQSLTSFLKSWTETFNTQCVRKLMRLNTLEMSDYPKIQFGSLERVDLGELGDFISKCASSGMELFDDDNFDEYVRRAAGWPERQQELVDVSDITPQPNDALDVLQEVHTDEEADAWDARMQGLPGAQEGVTTNVAPAPKPVLNVKQSL